VNDGLLEIYIQKWDESVKTSTTVTFVNRFLAARRFTVDHLTRYYQGIYHLEHKQENLLDSKSYFFWKILNERNQHFFVSLCSRWCMLKFFLAGKIQGGTPLQFLSQKSSGEMLCKFFPIFPPKVLVYIGQIFWWHLCN